MSIVSPEGRVLLLGIAALSFDDAAEAVALAAAALSFGSLLPEG